MTENDVGSMKKGPLAPKLSGGHNVIKVPDVGCAIHDLTSYKVLMTKKL